MLVAILLLSGLRYAHAQVQNTGAYPYRDSEHSYRVPIGSSDNKRTWIITDGTTSYTIFSDETVYTPLTWASPIPTGGNPGEAGLGYHGVRIFFSPTIFTSDTWTLQYFEYLEHESGTLECISARHFEMTLSDNTFYLVVADDVNACNSQTSLVHAYTDLNEPTDVFATSVTYTVTMNKDDDFDPTSWGFEANFSQAVTAISQITSDGSIDRTQITAGTDYRFVVTPSLSNPSAVTVTITVEYENTVLSDVTRNMTVTNGQAIFAKANAPDAVTLDDITQIDGTPNRLQAINIRAIPATRDIEPGTGETATSAGNPLQNSTHRYNVTMESYDNNTRAWTIRNSSDDLMVAGTHYTLVQTNSGNVVTAAITFSDPMPAGTYTLYFKETNPTTTCSTIRAYPFTLHGPFDADLASISPICPTASNEIFATNSPSVTEVNYTVTLNNTGYGSAWSFNFNLSSSPVFNVANVTVSGTTVTPATVSYNNGTGLVNVPADVEEVTLTVTYNGIYETAHTITATLTNVTGSYNETDSDTDAISHTIHALPQAGAIAGIE